MTADKHKEEMEDCAATETTENGDPVELPQIDFSAFIISLSHNALSHLNEAKENKDNAKIMLPLAKQFIDILDMLKEKTAGNLTKEEEKLLQSLLFDLQLNYIEACKLHS